MLEIKVKNSLLSEIDNYGRCDEKIKELTRDKNSSKQMLQALIADMPNESLHMEGKEFELLITAPRREYDVVNTQRLLNFLGEDKFFELAHFSIEEIRKWLNPEQLEEVIHEKLGPRAFKATRRIKITQNTQPLTIKKGHVL